MHLRLQVELKQLGLPAGTFHSLDQLFPPTLTSVAIQHKALS